jgi:hypothetical protein
MVHRLYGATDQDGDALKIAVITHWCRAAGTPAFADAARAGAEIAITGEQHDLVDMFCELHGRHA